MARNRLFWLNHFATGTLMIIASIAPPLSLPALASSPKPILISQSLSWGDLFKLLAPRRTSGGSRTESFCWTAMSEQPNVTNFVATGNPTFYWQSGTSEIGIRIFGENQPFWKKSVSPNARQLRYDGEPLSPNVDYELIAYRASGRPIRIMANFQVLTSEVQLELKEQLKSLSGKDEASLLKRAMIYSDRQLTSDALGELLTVRNPSAELKSAIQQIPKTWCPKTS